MKLILKPQSPRISRLGQLGEMEEALKANGFQDVRNLNHSRHNQPFADLLAEKDGSRYFIGVKARNEKQCGGRLNDSNNCVLVANDKNMAHKALGKTTGEITQMALEQVCQLAAFEAIPAWMTIPIRADEGTYSVYFGLLSQLGNQRSIPMTTNARKGYQCLVDWVVDKRITPDLTNKT
jgi:hypothetical protein